MRIGIITQWPFPESPDDRCRKIVGALADAGYEVTVFTPSATRCRFVRGDRFVEVKSPRQGPTVSAPIPGNPYWTIWLIRQARQLQLDWLMSKELRLGLSTYWAARASRSRFWIDLSENYPGMVRIERRGEFLMPLHAAVAGILETRCARQADLVTVVTRSNGERLAQQGVSSGRLVVVSNTPELRPMPTRNGAAVAGKLNLVYAGILSKVRGLERLLKALWRIGPENESVCLHIVGEGSEAASLQALTESLELTNCVQFHGWVAKAELPSLFARCDAGVIPHLVTEFTQTTIPNKLFDYMACGLPVWTTSMRPCRDVIDVVDCGWVSDDSVDGMAAVLSQLLRTSEKERREKGERARQAVLTSYNWDRDRQRMLDALVSLA